VFLIHHVFKLPTVVHPLDHTIYTPQVVELLRTSEVISGDDFDMRLDSAMQGLEQRMDQTVVRSISIKHVLYIDHTVVRLISIKHVIYI
jgi:hypothetical protein